MLILDGSMGEGGGQILRTSLALSLVSATPFRIENIRGKRSKPGLLRQHLAAAKAAESIGATVEGAELGSGRIEVHPAAVRGGGYRFAVGSAGSACLVLQTVLPPLLASGEAAQITFEGGTHNPFAPPYDFIERAFLQVLARMGAKVKLGLNRRGFYPAGGGSFDLELEAGSSLDGLELLERGETVARQAHALVAHLPGEIAKRELAVVREKLGWSEAETRITQIRDSAGPGNVVILEVESEHAREICTGFGQKGVKAETVARQAVDELRQYLASGAPVGRHLADQLIVPFAMAGRGAFRTALPLSAHTRTNLDVVRAFLPVRIDVREADATATIEFSRSA
ncbi:MAG TPA: RNA 3'-terminal phosphate cyclase [Myxococcota bacterium]|nr:RNA 3'-terminal phosphate cyclase [Myxococcota bacterium]